ncbi:conserved oligomeric Golgi complex subunit 2 [Stomoxys calcitrans]|uniref:conserved oligomeric Golgi complex subunit 2 n=1 Tax=Stomoxys calcitrans TaxID=35570 RepID=UPI0027E220B8|nr:conserved oligomeric Golgi complex subunit 2 [Stomoxys calcitrans]
MIESVPKNSARESGEKLCFDKNEFLKTNFSVDDFLHKNRNVSSLELLRDDLGLYLKSLRASMIDLINEDYADFVSLSANLVGLDQSIDTIQKPLEEFREEILSIQSMIDENVSEIREKLEAKRQLRNLRRNLQSLKKVYETTRKLEDLLANQLREEVKTVDLERAALDLVQLKFNEKFCNEYLSAEAQTNIRRLESEVHKKLRALFAESLKIANATCSESLERCLRIYITLDACTMAEMAFKEDIVAPYMSEILTEHNLQQTPQGLAGIYSKVLNFISLHMTDLLRLTQYTDKLRGFNFVVNSFWSDVEMRLENHMSSIFAPGNSEVFYAKYKCTRDFLSKIEELLATEDSIEVIKQHKQTKSFEARWNLPVYFQICFQEIAGKFEATLEPPLTEDALNTNSAHFQFKTFSKAMQAIESCWSEGVFLIELFPKFYKLHIQILLRLSHWIKVVLSLITSKSNTTMASLKFKNITLLTALHSDINKLLSVLADQEHQLVSQHLKPTSVPKLQQNQLEFIRNAVSKSFEDIKKTFSQHLLEIQRALVENVVQECGPENVKQVNDLPRLYRKTNRDVPTRCSAYVEQMLKPLKNFKEEFGDKLGDTVVRRILEQVLNKITTDYLDVVKEVLTSVQKTEESLRRLRSLKGQQPTLTGGATMSDDDKIRLQLRVDVSSWTTELSKLGFMPSDVEQLMELNNIVEDSIKVSK